ncbi:MAG: hypothetical protein AAFX85_01625 [Pseudomonadota bacterium]
MAFRVLYVEDTDFDRVIFGRYFSRLPLPDVQVDYAESLNGALGHLRDGDEPPDLMFLDNGLPPYRTFRETLPQLTNAGYAGPVVLLSGVLTDDMQVAVEARQLYALIDKQRLDTESLSDIVLPHIQAKAAVD